MTELQKHHHAALYRDYLNNYISVERFAEYNHYTVNEANALIALGKEYHEQGY